MAGFVLRRVAQSVAVILVMSVLVFLAVYAIGNPVEALIDPRATQADIERATRALGLDRPLWEQYLTFLGNIARGDAGISWVFNEPALKIMLQRLPATLELVAAALLLSLAAGIPLGLYAGYRPDSRITRAIMAGSILGFSLPAFWFGLMLILIFGVELNWLPVLGRGETAELFGIAFSFLTLDGLAHLLLPALTLALSRVAMIIRLVRAGVREAALQDYVRFARAKGLTEGRILRVHILKNALIPVITVVGADFAGLLAFAVVTETVFAWPGMGKLIIDSIQALDRPVVVAYLMITVLMFIVINLVVDLLYSQLDPRIRLQDVKA